jgi:plasmid segregation protein ParM
MSTDIGIDVGYGNTKVVASNGTGKIDGKQFRSIVGLKAEVNSSLQVGFNSEVISVEVDGVTYMLGATAEQHSSRLLNSRDRAWITTAPYRALIKHALLMGIENKDISGHNQIVTGLPVKYFLSDKDKVARIVSEVASSIGLQAEVGVVPQPLGTYMDSILDDDGGVSDHSREDLHGRLGVLDIGFFTTDLVTIEKRQVTDSLSMSIESGVASALEEIRKDIEDGIGFEKRQTTIYEVEAAIRSGFRIKVFGEYKCIKELATKRLMELTSELKSKAYTVWHNGADLEKVILTGGGAELLSPYWSLYPHAKVVRSAALANATGYCKYAARISQRSAA